LYLEDVEKSVRDQEPAPVDADAIVKSFLSKGKVEIEIEHPSNGDDDEETKKAGDWGSSSGADSGKVPTKTPATPVKGGKPKASSYSGSTPKASTPKASTPKASSGGKKSPGIGTKVGQVAGKVVGTAGKVGGRALSTAVGLSQQR
jgi:hypothetical protein